jgi:hypothetical protein
MDYYETIVPIENYTWCNTMRRGYQVAGSAEMTQTTLARRSVNGEGDPVLTKENSHCELRETYAALLLVLVLFLLSNGS